MYNKIVIVFLLLFGNAVLRGQQYQGASFGGVDNDAGLGICLSQDGGYAIVGTSRSWSSGNSDIVILKTREDGTFQWRQSFGDQKIDIGRWIEATSDGGFIIAGYGVAPGDFSAPRHFIAKLNAQGNTEWSRFYEARRAYCVKEVIGEGYVFLAFKAINGNYGGFHLSKLDLNGNVLWVKNYETEAKQKDYGFELEITPEGGFILVGISDGFHSPEGHDYEFPDTDILVIKTDSDGDELWRKELGGVGHDFGHQVELAPNGGYFIAASTQSEGAGSFDMQLLKIDENGEILFSQTYGGSDFEYGSGISINDSNEIFLIGTTNSFGDNDHPNIMLVKADLEGEPIWTMTIGGDDSDYGFALRATGDGGCVAVGSTKSYGNGGSDIYLFRLDGDGNFSFIETLPRENDDEVIFYPNPMDDFATLEIPELSEEETFEWFIFNAAGSLLKKEKVTGSKTFLSKQEEELIPGTYFFEIIMKEGKKLNGKFIVH